MPWFVLRSMADAVLLLRHLQWQLKTFWHEYPKAELLQPFFAVEPVA